MASHLTATGRRIAPAPRPRGQPAARHATSPSPAGQCPVPAVYPWCRRTGALPETAWATLWCRSSPRADARLVRGFHHRHLPGQRQATPRFAPPQTPACGNPASDAGRTATARMLYPSACASTWLSMSGNCRTCKNGIILPYPRHFALRATNVGDTTRPCSSASAQEVWYKLASSLPSLPALPHIVAQHAVDKRASLLRHTGAPCPPPH